MALKNVIDPHQAGSALERWYAECHPEADDVQVTDVHVPKSNGMSSETVLFDLMWSQDGEKRTQGCVVRVTPTSGGLLPSCDLRRESAAIDAVRTSTTVPVPATFGVEQDASVLGAPFLLMERLSGRVPADDPPFTATGWVTELATEQQSRMYDNALAAMAGLHTADLNGLDSDTLGHPARGGDPLSRQIEHYQRLYTWTAAGRPNPTIEGALAWIGEHAPTEQAITGLSWGDARVGNMMFGDDLTVTGVLDWEMVTIGEAELDLTWFMFLNRNHTEGLGIPGPPGFPDREATLTRYEQLIGRPLRHIEFHEVFAATRASILLMRIGVMMIEHGLLSPDATMPITNPASLLLARLLGLPAPGQDATWITGNRENQ